MIRTFIKNSSVYLVTNFVSKAINLGLFAYVVRLLTQEQMGRYSLLSALTVMMGLFMTLEIQSGFTRYYLDFEQPAERKTFERSLVNLLLIANIFLGTILFILKPIIEHLVIPIHTGTFLIILVTPAATAVSSIYLAKLRLDNRPFQTSVVLLSSSAGCALVTIALIKAGAYAVTALFGGLLAQSMISVAIYLIESKGWQFVLRPKSLRQSIKFSALLIPAVVGSNLMTQASKFLLGKLLSVACLGAYEANNKIASMLMMISDPIYQATLPIVYQNYKRDSFIRRYRMIYDLNMAVLLLLVAVLCLFRNEFVLIIAGHRYLGYSGILCVLAMASQLSAAVNLLAINIHLSGKTQYTMIPQIVSGLLNTALNVILIRRYGLNGAMAAMLTAFLVRYLIFSYYAGKTSPKLYAGHAYVCGYAALSGIIVGAHYAMGDWSILARLPIFAAELFGMVALIAYKNGINPRRLPEMLLRDAE